ncbi:MAG: hypothetical protein ACRERD_00615 [Candidatus Binatia bacterium]
MTNEQLLILIRAWRSRLEREIHSVRELAPDSWHREEVTPWMELLGERQEGDFLELAGLKALLVELDEAIETLRSPKNQEKKS